MSFFDLKKFRSGSADRFLAGQESVPIAALRERPKQLKPCEALCSLFMVQIIN
jgi:hypothetical protein